MTLKDQTIITIRCLTKMTEANLKNSSESWTVWILGIKEISRVLDDTECIHWLYNQARSQHRVLKSFVKKV